MVFCPECKLPGAYVGLNIVECPNTRCKHYTPNAVPAGLIVAPGGGVPRPRRTDSPEYVAECKRLKEIVEEVKRDFPAGSEPGTGEVRRNLHEWTKELAEERDEEIRRMDRRMRWEAEKSIRRMRHDELKKSRLWNDPPFVHAFKTYFRGAVSLLGIHTWHEDLHVYPLRFAARLVGISFDPAPDGVSLRRLCVGSPNCGNEQPFPISLAPKLRPVAPQMPTDVNGRVQMEFIYEGEPRPTKELFPNERLEIFLWLRYMQIEEAQIWFPAGRYP